MKKTLYFTQTAFSFIALLFLIYFAWRSQDLFQTLLAQTQWHYLASAVLFWVGLHFVIVQRIKLQLLILHTQLPYAKIFYIHINRLPARYIPGGIWHSVSKIVDFHQLGIEKSKLGALFLLENIQAVWMAFLLGGSLVFYFRGSSDIWGIIAGLSVLTSSIGIVMTPLLWSYAKLPQLHVAQYFKTLSIFPLIWAISSSAFILYLSAFPQLLNQMNFFEIAGNYIFSWGIGYLAIFAPQGIGVFEIVSGNLLDFSMQLIDAAIIIAGFRMIVLCADITLWVVLKIGVTQFK